MEWCILKTEEGATSQEMQVDSRRWRNQGNDFSSTASRKIIALLKSWFLPVILTLGFWVPHCKRMNCVVLSHLICYSNNTKLVHMPSVICAVFHKTSGFHKSHLLTPYDSQPYLPKEVKWKLKLPEGSDHFNGTGLSNGSSCSSLSQN